MLLRGISFEIPNDIGISLYNMLSDIDVKKINWYIEQRQSEVLTGDGEEYFFTKSVYNGNDFFNMIKNKLYLIFLKLYGYQGTHINTVHSFEDFKRHNCRLLILINDCKFVEIYASNMDDIKKLYGAAERNNYQEIRFITDINDKRVRFDVL